MSTESIHDGKQDATGAGTTMSGLGERCGEGEALSYHRLAQPYLGLKIGLEAVVRKLPPEHPLVGDLQHLLALANGELHSLRAAAEAEKRASSHVPEGVDALIQALLRVALEKGARAHAGGELDVRMSRKGGRLHIHIEDAPGGRADPRLLALGSELAAAGAQVAFGWSERGRTTLDARVAIDTGEGRNARRG